MVNVHELANAKGYGSAKKSLQKAGLWDEYHGMKEREFAVDIVTTVTIEDAIIVTARHSDEAEEKACKKFASLHDCDESDIDEITIIDSLEAKE